MAESLYQNPDLIFKDDIPSGKTGWKSPSNIALVKYWGKKPVQIPMNPSISFTLEKSYSETITYYEASNKGLELEFYFEGERNEAFETKTKKFFKSISGIFPFVNQLKFKIYSKNSFPHSAGIASSASGMSALALTLCDIENQYFNTLDKEEFFRKASYVARLGSGSACRSVYGGAVVWGETDAIKGSSDLFGIDVSDKINNVFLNYRDTILLVDSSAKKVSSRAGHSLMETNVYAKTRFAQANDNLKKIYSILKQGDQDNFINLVESEALTLHAMMMTSNPYYILLKPNTLNIINKLFDFRNETKIPVCFTLDAGPNVHLLYPGEVHNQVKDFINAELSLFLSDKGIIEDKVGKGPEKINL